MHSPRRRPTLLPLAALLLTVAAGGTRAAEPKTIALPPYLVEEKAQRLPWQYAEVGNWEVLSTCPEKLTRALVANHYRLHALLAELLPPSLQFTTTEKQTLLFVDSAQQPPTSQEVVAAMSLTAAEQDRLDDVAAPLVDDGRLRRRPLPPRYTFVPNLRLWDRDSGALFAIVREADFHANRIALTPDYVAYLLRNRLPALPPWFVSGILTLFARATFTEDALTLERQDWLSEIGSAALRAGPASNRALLPLAEFFAGDLSSGDPAQNEALALWQAQAALFIRWGLAGRGAPRREGLWNFVSRAATEPVTEALFRECFGLDFATAHQQLTTFLPEAMRDRLALRPAQRPRLPDYPLRAATADEIARIKGDWERLEIAYVKMQFPVLAPKYAEQSRRTLMRARDAGSRDSRLLAILGLCEVDAGNDSAALPLLEEAATRTKSLRPRAAYELARLRFAGRTALTGAQINEILTPLLATREQQPPFPEIYELIATVWAASAEPLTRDQLAVLEAGVRLFPRRSELVYRTADLALRHNFPDAAKWLIPLGATLAPDTATRTRFESLQSRLNSAR